MKKKTISPHADKAEFEALIAAMEQETAALRRGIRRVYDILIEADLCGSQVTSLSLPRPRRSAGTEDSKIIRNF
ncbi:MAG: hypothetical protein U0176_05330 [Bacteroidia bacterium]